MGYTGVDMIAGGGNDYAHQAARAERQRQQAITTGTQNINDAFSGFDDNFYGQRAKAYQNFEYPQLAQQYRDTSASMNYGLANRGLGYSTAANQARQKLDLTNAQARQGIADAGIAQSQALKQQVENQRNTLLGNLYQSADSAQAQRGAIAAASNFVTPSVYPALANQFQSIAQQYYLNQTLNNYRNAYAAAQTPPPSDWGVNSSAVKF